MEQSEINFLKAIFGVYRKDLFINSTISTIDQANSLNIASINLEKKLFKLILEKPKENERDIQG